MAFSIVTREFGVARLAIEGQLDATTIWALQRELSTLLRRHPNRVEVDVSGLSLIDTSGVGLLLSFFKKLSAQGGLLMVSGLRDQPLALFALLKLERLFAGSTPSN